MASKTKQKPKAAKKAPGLSSSRTKSLGLKAKSSKVLSRNGSRNSSKPAPKEAARRTSKPVKVESRRSALTASSSSARSTSPERARSKHFASAVQAYEAAIKLMHAEQFEKAIRGFEELVAEHADEPEIQERAKVLIHACEKKINDRGRTVLRSADDHYNVGIADINRRELASAVDHLQHALKLAPKADHILYALATANALQGNRDQALQNLKQSIHYRLENRFLAARDSDFESLQDDADFKQLVTSAEK